MKKKFKGVRFFILLAIISSIGLLLSLYPGTFSFQWLGYTTTMPIAAFFVAAFLLFALLLLILHIYLWIVHLPLRSRQYIDKKRNQKIDELILEGFEAIASQEYSEAQTVSALALKLKPNNPLALLLEGQTCYLKNDLTKAHLVFSKMIETPALKFLGLRGLAMMAIERGDFSNLESLLKQLYELRPHSPWVLKQLSHHYLLKAKTDTSVQPLPELPFYLHLSKEEADLHQGLLLWIKYCNVENKNLEVSFKIQMLKNMYDLLPKNPVIACELARLMYYNVGRICAMRVLFKTYKRAPHRMIGQMLVTLTQPKNILDTYKKLEKLCAPHPLHEESCYLLADVALKAKLWGQARHHLTPALVDDPSLEICNFMIALEEGEYPENTSRAEFWKEQAQGAAHYQWRCESCRSELMTFEALCPNCGQFGTIVWRKPVTNKTANITLLSSNSPYERIL